ncbi:MAG TPA: transposase family protein [Saprospiraceae bacterium]|nr:transposase family protein [Saprospiraceae bacterium]
MPRSKPYSVLPIKSIRNNIILAKKTHTVKAMIISAKPTKIRYLSHYRVGKTHDDRFLKEEFPPTQNWFAKFNVRVDVGYLGIVKDDVCKSIMIPHNKSKKHPLTDPQKRENSSFAADRVAVEHSIDGIKRYRFRSDRLRTHDLDLYDNILEVCAGLWNFYLAK